MKKLLLLVFCGVLCINLIIGQESPRWKFQVNLAINKSFPSSKETSYNYFQQGEYLYTSYSGHWGYLFEAGYNSNIISNFSLFFGVNYNANRYKVGYEYEYFRYDGIMYSSYVNIPFLVNYKIQQFSVSTGVFLGMRISTFERLELVTKEGFTLINSSPYHLIKDYKIIHDKNYVKSNYGLILQADYEYQLNQKLSAVVFSRFTYGFKNTIKEHHYINYNRKWNTCDVALGLGLRI